jgi:hypothetical protein
VAAHGLEGGFGLHAWLLETLVTFHRLQVRVVGEAFWGIHRRLPGWQTGPEGMNAPTVRWSRGDVPTRIAAMAWTHAGGQGDPPAWVVDAFSLLTSSFAGKGLSVPVPRSPEETGRISAKILTAVVRTALLRSRLRCTRPPRAEPHSPDAGLPAVPRRAHRKAMSTSRQ